MTRLAVMSAGLALGAAAPYRSRTGCPLQVRRVYLNGKAPQVVVRNKATYPVGHIVVHGSVEWETTEVFATCDSSRAS